MPTSVASAFKGAGLRAQGVVQWRSPVPVAAPGVYIVALTAEADDITATRGRCPISQDAVSGLLDLRPELRVDGSRPDAVALASRLASCWLPDEVIVYIGLAGTSLTTRVAQYYATPLGARRPHAGGWPLKTLSVLDRLWVHYSACDDTDGAERAMVDAFIGGVSASSRASLCDPQVPLPFANLQVPRGPRKQHGITGAREPANRSEPEPSGGATRRGRGTAGAVAIPAGAYRTQRMTAKDIEAGQVRVPRAAKQLLPNARCELTFRLRGRLMTARWDPRTGPDRERSGVLRLGRARLEDLVSEDEVLAVWVGPSGQLELS